MSGQPPEPDPQAAPATAPPTNPDALLDRLRAAAADLEAKREAVTPALELRDQLIVQAREIGQFTYSEIARAAGCSKAAVFGVLAAH
jgi:DNA-directed RNA polymerase specialized sigma24 family protein